MSIVTKFSKNSPEVVEAKIGEFETVIKSVTAVNGSKYKPGHWRKDMFEVETDDGVYITEDDFTNRIGKLVVVSTNKNSPDIGWIWINFKHFVSQAENGEEPRFVKLEDALRGKIPAKLCYVYRIEVGPEIYVGFTSGDPQKRIDKHIERSRDGATRKVNIALRKWGYHHTWSVISEHENEVLALLAEKIQIAKLNAALNESPGGEGDDFNIVEQIENGENIFFVHDKNGVLKK